MSARLHAWLKGIPPEARTDLFEMAVVQGMAAQESLLSAMRGFLSAEPEIPGWLARWATKLTDEEVRQIEAKRDEEEGILRQDIEILLGGDVADWTEHERAHTAMVQARLSAVTLVLRAREEGQIVATFLPTPEVKKAASSVA